MSNHKRNTIKIEVTQRHIDEASVVCGFGAANRYCPIALAIKEHFNRMDVSVGTLAAHVGGCEVLRLPLRAKRFIAKFDHRQPVKPFSFRARLEAKDDRKEVSNGSATV